MEIGESVAVPPAATASTPKPRVTSVVYLNGDNTTALLAGGKQFVNFPRDAKWVDTTNVTTIDRLGFKPRIKVGFDQPGSHNVKLKFRPGASNQAYTGTEQGRNANFKFQDAEKSYTTDGDGTKIIENDFFVAAAGADTYEVVATDDENNSVSSTTLTVHRLMYLVEMPMRGLTTMASNLTTFKGEFSRHNIQLEVLARSEMDYMHNISPIDVATDLPNFLAKARTAYAGSAGPAKEPYVVAIAYTDHLAVKAADQDVSKAGVDVGPGKPDVVLDIVDSAAQTMYLWHDLVPGEGWFVSASYLKDGGTPGTDDVAIGVALCTAEPLNASNPNLWTKVKIKVDGLPAGTGTLKLRVNCVSWMAGGLSFGGNIICICTRSWWRGTSTVDQNQIMVHELGHQLKMAADGNGTGPDKVATHYTGKGHTGNHCHYNLAIMASYDNVAGSSCVMFGATNGITTFCANCSPAVSKQDLSSGFPTF
jgi:hypothetical protein